MKVNMSYMKGFFVLLIYCILVIFCCVFLIRFIMVGIHFFNNGIFDLSALEIRKTIVAGLVGGGFSAVGIWILSFLEYRERDKN